MFNKKEYQQRTRKERRLYLIKYRGGKCVQCGEDDPDLLDFDHIDPATKEFSISENIMRRLEVLLPEIDKCQLLCYEHHKIKTIAEKTTQGHGSHSKYTKEKCRCDKCVIAERAYMKAYRLKVKERKEAAGLGRKPIQHGTTSKYRQGCRCPDCKIAAFNYDMEYRERKKTASI